MRFCIIAVLLFMNFPFLSAQEHISHYLELEKEIVLPENSCVSSLGKIIGCMDGGRLYLCNAEVLKQHKKGFMLEVEAWDLADGSLEKIELPFPPLKTGVFGGSKYWLYAIAVHDGKIAVSTHSQLFVFDIRERGASRLEHSLSFPDADFSFFDGSRLYAVSQVNDNGFLLSALNGSRLDSIAAFPLSAPFLLQFGPNGFLKPHGKRLCFLDAPDAVLRQFDLQGRQQEEDYLDIPNWNAMPTDYIQSVQSMPYNGERAMHIFNTSTQYSFPLEVFPFNDTTFLIAYHQYDSVKKQFQIPFVFTKTTKNGGLKSAETVTTEFDDNHQLEPDEFPVLYANRALKFSTVGENRLIQVVKTSDIPYARQTWKHYNDQQEAFFATHEPISKIRVMRLKVPDVNVAIDSIKLTDSRGTNFLLDSVPGYRAIFVVNNPPQCHACEESVYDFVNSLDMGDCSMYVVERKVSGALARREVIQMEQSRLQVPFATLFVPADTDGDFSNAMGNQSYPLILLWEKGWESMKVISGNRLFPENPWETNLRPEAQMKIRQFVR